MKYFLVIYTLINGTPTPVIVAPFETLPACKIVESTMMFGIKDQNKKQNPDTQIEVITSGCIKIFQL